MTEQQALQVQDNRKVAQTASEQLISSENAYRPDIDIFHTPEAFIFWVDLPGVKQGDVQLEINERNTLILRARNSFVSEAEPVLQQSHFGNYYRAFELGEEIDREKVTARLESGLLEVRIAKREASHPRKIEIQA